jgi:hypothetical protein
MGFAASDDFTYTGDNRGAAQPISFFAECAECGDMDAGGAYLGALL